MIRCVPNILLASENPYCSTSKTRQSVHAMLRNYRDIGMPTRRRPFVASFSAQRQCRLLQRPPGAAETPDPAAATETETEAEAEAEAEEAADGDAAAAAETVTDVAGEAETVTDVAAETDEDMDMAMATALALSRSLVPVPAPAPAQAPVGTNAGMMTAMNLTSSTEIGRPRRRGHTRVRTYGDASPLPASCPTPP